MAPEGATEASTGVPVAGETLEELPTARPAVTEVTTQPSDSEAVPEVTTEPSESEAVPEVTTEPSESEAVPEVTTEASESEEQPGTDVSSTVSTSSEHDFGITNQRGRAQSKHSKTNA